MKVNYHTHTHRCKHACGTEEEYVKVAISRGVEKLGFSDHAPIDYGDFVSTCRMAYPLIDEYFETLLDLKHKYRDYIELLIGFEIEYSVLFDKSVQNYKKYPLDYLILGQHFVGLESDKDMINVFIPTSSEDTLKKYVDECIKGIKTGLLTYVAHPDCINYTGNMDVYDKEMGRLIKVAQDNNLPLELNLLGVRKDRNYPCDRFFSLLKGSGAKVIIGCDAHSPEHIAVPDELIKAYKIIDRYGLEIVEDCKIIDPFKGEVTDEI